jgi:iron-sulfur cluster assembly protein
MATAARPRPQVMTLTDAAAARVRAIMAKSENGAQQIRVGVKNGGCAGMEYTLEWVDAPKPFDEVVENKGVRVLIESKALMFLLGTEMDYQTSVLKSGFVFNNPNQVSACGCGESVEIRPAAAPAT